MPSPYLSGGHREFALQVRQILQSQLLPIAEAAEARGHLCENAWQSKACSACHSVAKAS